MGIAPRTGRLESIGLPLLSALVLIVAAEGAKRFGLLPVSVPAPSQVWGELTRNPILITGNIAPTVWKAAAGYGVALLATAFAASLAACMSALYGPIYNLGVILHAIPVIATAPLFALWLGTGPTLHILIAAGAYGILAFAERRLIYWEGSADVTD